MRGEQSSAEKLVAAPVAMTLVILGIMFFVPLATLCGAVTGWVVGWLFGDTILSILAQIGVHNVTMWQFGAFMGFVGGFLKTKVTAEVKQS